MSGRKWVEEKHSGKRESNSTGCPILDKKGQGAGANYDDDGICLSCPLPQCILCIDPKSKVGRTEIRKLAKMYVKLVGVKQGETE